MQSRPSASLGCFGTLSVIGVLFASYAFLRLITKVPPRAYSLLEIWVAVATFGIPIIYVLMLVVGRIRLNSPLGGSDPTEPFAFMLGRLRESRSEHIYTLALALFVLSSASGIGWSLFNHFLSSITPADLKWWAILATTGNLLLAGLGSTLGATPMEDQRRVGLAGFVGLFFLFSVPYSLYLWTHSRALPMSFWASIPISVICIVLTWRYLSSLSSQLDVSRIRSAFVLPVGHSAHPIRFCRRFAGWANRIRGTIPWRWMGESVSSSSMLGGCYAVP